MGNEIEVEQEKRLFADLVARNIMERVETQHELSLNDIVSALLKYCVETIECKNSYNKRDDLIAKLDDALLDVITEEVS